MTEDSVLNSEPTCDLFAVYATAKDIACAMAYIHSKDIIHGDLQGDAVGLASSTQDPRGFIAKVDIFHPCLFTRACARPKNVTIWLCDTV